jgi:glycosyltransferase involved in cell wall biosynthesis
VGRLVEEKGVMDLYDAFKKTAYIKKNLFLKIVGSGPLENKLRTLMQIDNLQKRVTIERKSYQQMPGIFQEADVLCVPSKKSRTWEEQLGMVFIEAMASGIPIITYDTGVIRSVVKDAGIVLKEGDVQGIATSIIRIIEARELGHKIGTIGRERAKSEFDARKTANKLFEMYKSL